VEWSLQRVETSVPSFLQSFQSYERGDRHDRVSHQFPLCFFLGWKWNKLFCSFSAQKNCIFDQKGRKSGERIASRLAAHQAHHAINLCRSFRSSASTHSINSTKKKMTFDRRFRMSERVVHGVEMACIFTDWSTTTTTTKQQNKFDLAIKACWQNFFCANIVEEHLQHLETPGNTWQHLVGCIGPLTRDILPVLLFQPST
jgi:hypothetical protein